MIFINQHVCVFLTATELSEEKQKEFFYRMCTALQYDLQKMKSLSVIYACYGLFGGSPLTDTDLKKLSRLAPCENCEKLLKKSIYKAFPIKENACSMCIFSNRYLNARENEERIALKHFMMPGKKYEYLQLLPENAFTSVFRLESDYTLGNIPTIPFHRFLYQYLENNPYIETEENTFFDGLLHYMKSNMDTLIDLDKYKPQLTTYFNNIIKLDEKSVTDDIYEDAAAHLKLPYVYQTPLKPAKPVIAGSPDRKKKKRQMRKKEQTDYDIMSLGLFARDSEESVEEKALQEEPVNMTAGMDGLYTLNLHDMFFPDDNSSPSKKVDVLLPERASNEVSVKISDESPDNILNNAKDIFSSDSEQKDTSSAYAIPPCIHSGPAESDEPSSRETAAREEIATEESVPSDTIMEESASLSCKEENKIETNTAFASLSSVPTETPTDTPAEDDMAEFDFFDNPFDDFDDNFSIEAEDGDPGFPSISGIDDKITASQNVSNKGQEFSENTLNSNTVITTDNNKDIVMTTNSDKNLCAHSNVG